MHVDKVRNDNYGVGFYDSVHMNRTGATKYTKMLVGELRTNRNTK